MNRLVLSILSIFVWHSAYAEPVSLCRSRDQYSCTPLTPQQQLAAEICGVEMKEARCDEYFKSHPDLAQGARRNCNLVASCSTPEKVRDYTKACLENWAGAWGDILTGIYHIVAGDVKPSVETKARETFFENCKTVQCKRSMLGPYADLFTKEEIEGQPYDKKFFDSNDPANTNFIQGHSAKVLYKKLIERISKKMRAGTLDQPVLEPWSGKPAKPLKTVQELIDDALTKMGIKNSACYDPVVLSEMRCYALFTVLDPLVFVSAAGKVAALSGKSLEKVLAKEAVASEAEAAQKVALSEMKARKSAAIKAHANPKIDNKVTEAQTSATSQKLEAKKNPGPTAVEADSRFMSVSDEMRFLNEPASWDYLEAVRSHVGEDNFYWGLNRESFKEHYKNYRASTYRVLADVLKVTPDEAKANPLLKDFLLHPLELQVIRKYTGDLYPKVNGALRDGNWKEYGLETEILNSALSRLRREQEWMYENASWLKNSPKETLVKRYIRIDSNKPVVLKDFLAKYKVGSRVEEKSFVSTTLQDTTENLYVTGNIRFEITQKSGVYISTLSSVTGKNGKMEAEVLLPPKTRFIVTEVNHVNSGSVDYVIKMKEEGL